MDWVSEQVKRKELRLEFYVGVALNNGEAAELTKERDPKTRFTWLGDLKQLMGDITEPDSKWEINFLGYRFLWFYGKGFIIHYLLTLLLSWMAPYLSQAKDEAPKYPPRRPMDRNYQILRYPVSRKNIMVSRNGVFCTQYLRLDHHSGNKACKFFKKKW